MGIGQLQIGTMGWYTTSRTNAYPDGEEIHTLGWCDGVIAAPAATGPEGVDPSMRYWIIIPKKSKKRR